jgi:lipopolysaccharide export system protein LptA
MFFQPNKLPALLGILLISQLGMARAEKADRDKPIHIESDKMSLDNANHVSIFEGKVELTQGTLRVLAEKAVVTEDAAGNKFCVATGHLASFRQKRDLVDEYVEGYGERIEYDTIKEQIDLFVRARVKREQDDVRGDHITYNTQTEIFRVNSPVKTGRVRATLQPQNKNNPAPAKDSKTKAQDPKASESKTVDAKVTETKTVQSGVAQSSVIEAKPIEPKAVEPNITETKSVEPATSDPAPASKQQTTEIKP